MIGQKQLNIRGEIKMSPNERLYEKTLAAINKLFSDIDVDKETTRRNLNSLIEEIRKLRFLLED